MNFNLPWFRATFVAFIVAAMAHLAMALEERGFVFDIHGDQVTITGYSGSGRDIKIPSELNGKAVVEIGSAAFLSSTTIRSVAIPSSVTSIGDRAFYGCTSLTRASFLGNAPAIGIDVFSEVGSGFKVYYPFYSDQTGFTTPTWSGYEVANLYEFNTEDVPGGVSIYGYSWDAVGVLNIPNELNGKKVVEIYSFAFMRCKGLTSVTIPENVSRIGSYAFRGSKWMKKLVIASKSVEIEWHAFRDCTSLENVTILGNITGTMGDSVFGNCRSLTSVTFHGNVSSVGSGAFSDCVSLNSVTFGGSLGMIEAYAFANCRNLTDLLLPSRVSYIGPSAFEDCTALGEIKIPSGITTIESGVFSGCRSLRTVVIPSSVTTIGYGAFASCSNLVNVNIPSAVTSLEGLAFSGCGSLRTVVIPSKVTQIGASAFASCSNLVNVTIPPAVTSIGNSAFSGCSNLVNVTIPSAVTGIGDSAFSGCSKLSSITIPSSVVSIKQGLFRGCKSLKSVKFLGNVTEIQSNAFEGCISLTSVTLPASLRSIGSSVFYRCGRLKNVTFLGKAPLLGDENSFYEVGSGFTLTRQSGAKGFDLPPWNFFKITTAPPLPWQSVEIGDGGLGGFDSFTDGTFTVNGAGKAGKASDRFRFVYQILSGDGEIVAKVDKPQASGSSSRVGVTIRNSLAPSAPYVFIGLGGDGACRWDQRKTSGINYDSNRSSGSAPDTWLRLVRNGSVVHAYKSGDGRTWAKVGSANTTLAKNCPIGLVVSSGSETLLNSAKFRNVEVKP